LRQLKELLTIELADKLGEQSLRISMRSICKRQKDISLRAAKEFSLRQRHASIRTNAPPPPVIDFNNAIGVEVFIGEKSIGGSDIEIVHAERTDGTLPISFVDKDRGSPEYHAGNHSTFSHRAGRNQQHRSRWF
jgi:hypothetical protein